jgi:hypothetical protein
MELYIYETPGGRIADFRPYLDGRDHSFDDHRPLKPNDPRWEKIHGLRDPASGEELGGRLRWVGTSRVKWHELMLFPIRWDREFEAVSWQVAQEE